MPFSSWLGRINKSTQTPVFAVWGNIIFADVVGLLYIVNTTAFSAIVSINTIASSLAYFIPIALRLTVARTSFKKGPFNLGPFSNIINFISCFWILFTSILFFFFFFVHYLIYLILSLPFFRPITKNISLFKIKNLLHYSFFLYLFVIFSTLLIVTITNRMRNSNLALLKYLLSARVHFRNFNFVTAQSI
jgi:amino acid transporter